MLVGSADARIHKRGCVLRHRALSSQNELVRKSFASRRPDVPVRIGSQASAHADAAAAGGGYCSAETMILLFPCQTTTCVLLRTAARAQRWIREK
jgi:hypothetical protein